MTDGQFGGFGLMDMLASFALFDDDPARVNALGREVRAGVARPDLEDGTGIPATG